MNTPLQIPRIVDMDIQRKKRIEHFLMNHLGWYAHCTTAELLLKFEHFLQQCEAERMSA